MVVPASSPVKSVQDLIALAKSKPGELNYGSFGNGSYSHVAMEDFKLRTKTDMLHIPYKGAAPAYTAILRNEVSVMLANLSGAAGHEFGRLGADHRSGRTAALEGAAGAGDGCGAGRAGLLDRRVVGPCSGRPTCRARWRTGSGMTSGACSTPRR